MFSAVLCTDAIQLDAEMTIAQGLCIVFRANQHWAIYAATPNIHGRCGKKLYRDFRPRPRLSKSKELAEKLGRFL